MFSSYTLSRPFVEEIILKLLQYAEVYILNTCGFYFFFKVGIIDF